MGSLVDQLMLLRLLRLYGTLAFLLFAGALVAFGVVYLVLGHAAGRIAGALLLVTAAVLAWRFVRDGNGGGV